jgi:hypothetical protein
LLGVLVVSPFIVFVVLWVSLEIVDEKERFAEETGVSNDEAGSMGGEVQRAVDNGEKGGVVMSGETKVDFGVAVSKVDTE